PENARMDRESSADVFLFEGFRLDRRGGVLYRLDREVVGTPVSAVGSRALNLLSLLIQRERGIVSKDEIMKAVWPGPSFEEANLNVQISRLRRILDENRKEGGCIRTIAGRGYCFVGSVKQLDTDAHAQFLTIHEGTALPGHPLSIVADREVTSAEAVVSDPS